MLSKDLFLFKRLGCSTSTQLVTKDDLELLRHSKKNYKYILDDELAFKVAHRGRSHGVQTCFRSGDIGDAAMECRHVFARSAITALLLASALVFRSESGPKSSTTAISYHDTTLHGSMNSVNNTGSVNVAVQALQLSRHLAGRGARGKRFLSSRFSYYANADSNFQLTRIASSGDVSPNPGPTGEGNNPAKCSGCNRTIARNHRAVECNHCYNMCHIKCGNVSPSQYNYFYKDRTSKWTCARCLAPATDISANIKNNLRKGIELDSLIPLKNCLHTKDVSIVHMNNYWNIRQLTSWQ